MEVGLAARKRFLMMENELGNSYDIAPTAYPMLTCQGMENAPET
jgi:hypothetical protein